MSTAFIRRSHLVRGDPPGCGSWPTGEGEVLAAGVPNIENGLQLESKG